MSKKIKKKNKKSKMNGKSKKSKMNEKKQAQTLQAVAPDESITRDDFTGFWFIKTKTTFGTPPGEPTGQKKKKTPIKTKPIEYSSTLDALVIVMPPGVFFVSTQNAQVSTSQGTWQDEGEGNFTTITGYFRTTFNPTTGAQTQVFEHGTGDVLLYKDEKGKLHLRGKFTAKRFDLGAQKKLITYHGITEGSRLAPFPPKISSTNIEEFLNFVPQSSSLE